jgi:hypothetical protein
LITRLQDILRKTVQIDFDGNVVPDFVYYFVGIGSCSRLGMGDSWTCELDRGKVQDELMLNSPRH